MALVLLAMIELQKDKTLRVFSNFKINAPRCYYRPYLFLEFEKLENCLILIDDVTNIRNIDKYSATVSNITRKLLSEMIFTGQYDKQIPPTIREQINYSIYPYYSKHNDTLRVLIVYDTGKKVRFEIGNIVRFIKKTNLYDTREKPPTILRSDAIREIAKMSKTRRDIEANLELYTNDKKEKEEMIKEILEHPEYKGSKNALDIENDDFNKYYKMYILNREFKVSQNKLAHKYKMSRTHISEKLKQIEYEITESNHELITR